MFQSFSHHLMVSPFKLCLKIFQSAGLRSAPGGLHIRTVCCQVWTRAEQIIDMDKCRLTFSWGSTMLYWLAYIYIHIYTHIYIYTYTYIYIHISSFIYVYIYKGYKCLFFVFYLCTIHKTHNINNDVVNPQGSCLQGAPRHQWRRW
jgi:hypothetical protein